jgi:glucokinase
MGNDGDCAALGEMWAGNGKGLNSGILITIGTGIGSGIIMDRKIFTGGTGVGTEAGHVPLVFNGELCGCGQHGCYEAYASCTALVRQTRAAMEKNKDSLMWKISQERGKVDGRTAFSAAQKGDPTAQQVIDQYISYLAAGLAGLINVFRPEIIIIGGGVSNEGDPLLVPLNRKIYEYCYGSDVIAPPKAIKAKLGNDAGIIGAALLCKDL